MVRRFGQKYSRIGIPVENWIKYTKFSKFYNLVRFYKYAGFYKHVKLFQVREISQLFQIYNYVSLWGFTTVEILQLYSEIRNESNFRFLQRKHRSLRSTIYISLMSTYYKITLYILSLYQSMLILNYA